MNKKMLAVCLLIISLIFVEACGSNSTEVSLVTTEPGSLSEADNNSGAANLSSNVIASPASTSPPVQTPEPPKTATLISAGDCVLHLAFQQSAYIESEDRYDFYDTFSPLEDYLSQADVSIISFESAATKKRDDYSGYPMFNCPPEIFDAFREVGFNIVNNSNNHQLDRRLAGMLETRDNIRESGLDVLGDYDGEEPRYIIKDINGLKIGIMAYTYSCNMNEDALAKDERYNHIALIDEERIKKELTELESKVDATVVCMHWGVEYTQKPTEQQKKLARNMIDWGADVILGSHPHVVEPSEMIELNGEQKYIIYSMGNFVSNQRRGASGYPLTHKELSEDSMLIKVEFVMDPESGKTVINGVTHIPTWLWRYTDDGVYKFKIIPVPSKTYYNNNEFSEEVLAEAYASYDRTMGLVKDYKSEP